jgi:hypothetical protein
MSERAKRRESQCGRNPQAGPGSCWFWWELCPARITDCFARRSLAERAALVASGATCVRVGAADA